jgi:DNA-binding FrmR family transcriptional regulator
MAHLVRDKDKLIARVRRMGGQLDAIERALVQEADCSDTLQLIASARGAMNGLMAEVLEGHIRSHFATATPNVGVDGDPAVDQLVEIVRTYLK